MEVNEFAALTNEHKEVYRIINDLKNTLESTDKYQVIEAIRRFKNTLWEIVDVHFSAEETILIPKLQEKEASPVECILNEHKELEKKKDLLTELLDKYEQKPNNLTYEALKQEAKDIADMLYNHAYSEDTILFSFANAALSKEEKQTIAEELAKISCKCCPKH